MSSMSIANARLLEDALNLPEKDRTPMTAAERRTPDEWLVEIERRARAAIAGSPGVPWDEARREIERRIAQAKR